MIDATATAARRVMYWDGVDHEDLFCVCGAPDPDLVWESYWINPRTVRVCGTCHAVADYDENALEWVVR